MADEALRERKRRGSDARRTAVRLGIAAALALLLAALVLTAKMWLLLFGAVLLALFLRGLSDWLAARAFLDERVAYAAVTLGLLALTGIGAWLLAPRVVEQVDDLAARLPGWLEGVRRQIAGTWWGARILEDLQTTGDAGALLAHVRGVLSGSTGALIQVFVLVVIGLYIGASPAIYVRGLVRLAPLDSRPRAEEVLRTVGRALRGYLLGRVVSMIAVGVLTAVGLALIGVRLAATLGILAGLLTFVPYAGPIVATIPIAIVAAMEGTSMLIFAVLYYAVVQCVEGFLVTPVVQQKIVRLPPAMTLAAQIFMGLLFGPLGVILSVPLAAGALVLVRMVYVGDILGEEEARPPEGA